MIEYEDTIMPEQGPCACCGMLVDGGANDDGEFVHGDCLLAAQHDAALLEREIDNVDALTRRWAVALCVAAGSEPFNRIGEPGRPRWLGYVYPATLVLKCRPHMEPSA